MALEQKIAMIIFKHTEDGDDNDYSVWAGFELEEKDEEKIAKILENCEGEGWSSRGNFESIVPDMLSGQIIESDTELYKILSEHEGHSLTVVNGCLTCKDCGEVILNGHTKTITERISHE